MPTVEIILPAALVALFPGSSPRLAASASNVSEAIDALDAKWPGMGDRIRDSTPAIRRHINVFVNGARATLGTALAPGAEIFVMTAISGG